jgi:preprotein translocase subunit SecE
LWAPKTKASSSIGRVAVSKTAGWGFETLLACHTYIIDGNIGILTMNDITAKTKFDALKWLISGIILIGGFVANYVFTEAPSALRLIGWLLIFLITVVIISQTQKGKKWREFLEGSRNELKKVVWPTRQETIQTTAVVVLMVVISALFLWAVDALLIQIIQFFTNK